MFDDLHVCFYIFFPIFFLLQKHSAHVFFVIVWGGAATWDFLIYILCVFCLFCAVSVFGGGGNSCKA